MALTNTQFTKTLGVIKSQPNRLSNAGLDIFAKKAKQIADKLRKKAKAAVKDNGAYAVIYSTGKFQDWGSFRSTQQKEYAVFVHENLDAVHPHGQAKFLEQPFREHKQELKDIVKKHAARTGQAGGGVRFGLLQASRRLLALSQKLVPTETGLLKKSGHIKRER